MRPDSNGYICFVEHWRIEFGQHVLRLRGGGDEVQPNRWGLDPDDSQAEDEWSQEVQDSDVYEDDQFVPH